MRDNPSLHRRRCIVYYFLPLVVWGSGNFHHDMRIILIFEKVPHVVVEETSLGHLECWSLWDMNDKFIPILAVESN